METINRTALLAEIKEFASANSGLIVGKPGVGKTFILNQLVESLLSDKVVCLMVSVNDLYDGSDDAIRTALDLPSSNWIDFLAEIDVENGPKGVLIFDAFDAARDEIMRSQILTQITKAKAKLATKYNIVVSVRTYDATKSEALVRLFPKGDPTHAITCRKKEIPNLSENEMDQLKGTNKKLYNFYLQSGQPLKEILRIPFFLYLAEAILKKATIRQIEEFKDFESESQLLNVFWNIKIVNTKGYLNKENLLNEISSLLVTQTKLNVPQAAITILNDKIGKKTFESLCAENILNQVSTGGNRVTFSHNIFFDYAVSRYTIPLETAEFIDFILTDKSRPFFLRPSYVYFFTQMWYENRDDFWRFYFILFQREEGVIQLFHRIVLASVLAACFSKSEDLEPIFKREITTLRPTIFKNLLQSLRFVRDKTEEKDVDLLGRLSTNLQAEYIADFTFLVNRAITDFKTSGQALAEIGKISRSLLTHALKERKGDTTGLYDWLGQFAVEYVCKTYQSDPQTSKQLLDGVLTLLKEKKFPIGYFTFLCEHISEVIGKDDTFVAKVYSEVFSHVEESNEPTTMGPASVVMSIRSTRKQDYEMCWYRLTELFPAFLQSSPEIAIEVGLNVANGQIIYNHGLRKEYRARVKFDLHGHLCELCADHSFARLGINDQDYSTRIINAIYEYLTPLVEDYATLFPILEKVTSKSVVGYTWSRLIDFGATYVEQLYPYYFDFCTSSVLLSSSDTIYELRALIEVIVPLLKRGQISAIEDQIHYVAAKVGDTEGYLQKTLSRIDLPNLTRQDSIDLLNKKGTTSNLPLAETYFESGIYTNEQFFADRGVDLTNEVNATFNDAIKRLDIFNNVWQNKKPTAGDYKEVLKFVFKTYLDYNDHKDIGQIIETALLQSIASSLKIICQDYSNIGEADFKEIREIILNCLRYLTPSEANGSSQGTASGGYSPTPRIEAAAALVYLWLRQPDEDLKQYFREIHGSQDQVVRFQAMNRWGLVSASAPDFYKEILLERVEKESDAFICAIIIGAIQRRHFTTLELDGILTKFSEKGFFEKQFDSFLESYSIFVINEAFSHDNEFARKILNSAVTHPAFCNRIIFTLFKYVSNCLMMLTDQKARIFIDLSIHQILRYVQVLNKVIKAKITIKGEDPSSVTEQYQIINQIILRLYFVFDRPGNVKGKMSEEALSFIYERIKPVLMEILNHSNVKFNGIILSGVTAHNLIQILNTVLDQEPKQVLKMVVSTLRYSNESGYRFDHNSIQQIVRLTEKLLADHRLLLQEEDSFTDLIEILEIYINSNWVAALQLLWRLDEVFK